MAFKVYDTHDGAYDFPTATVYHVDDDGTLHLSGPAADAPNAAKNLPLASLAPGQWVAVVRVADESTGPFHE